MTPFLRLPPPREAQQVAAFMRTRHHRRQRRLPSLFRLRPSFGRDRNYRRRTLLILALATDNTAADRPLLRQLLRETQRGYTLGLSWDIRDAVAVLTYLLYRHLHRRDIPLLWTARHSGGSDTYYSLDAEITFGFDATDTLHHLAKKRPPRRTDRDMAADIRHYLAQKDSHFRSRTDYLAYFAAQRLPLHLETLRESLILTPNTMHSISLICVALAAAIHYYIFYLEYPAYGSARFCRTFGVSPTELPTLRVPFRNLAIYNLMQAIGVSGGIVLSCAGVSPVLALSIMATPLAMMPAAGAYLSCTAPDKRRAACIQAIPPLLASFGLFLS